MIPDILVLKFAILTLGLYLLDTAVLYQTRASKAIITGCMITISTFSLGASAGFHSLPLRIPEVLWLEMHLVRVMERDGIQVGGHYEKRVQCGLQRDSHLRITCSTARKTERKRELTREP
jgi:hypothetical protein